MKTKIIFILLCLLSLNVMGQGTITRNKCRTCGEVISRCPYKGKHPAKPNPNPNPTPKPAPAPEAAGYDVTFSCNVSSATLYIDGNANGNASGTRFLKTGSHTIKVTTEGYKDYEGSISVNRQNKSCNITLEKKPEPARPKSGTLNGHEWVDLGLSVKWATCNVGASSPSDYGGYYAWGETSTKSRYDYDNCFDCLDSTGDSWGTYKLGGQTRIMPSSGHDTARENWGGTWRMPTDAENEELCNKCKWTWISQGGHNGYKVTGPNGNSIFLPAAGWRSGTDTYYVGECGVYWLSTLSSSDSYGARYLGFGSSSSSHSTLSYYRRCGQSVRPVTE